MKMPIRTLIVAILLGLLLASQSGCLLVAAAAGTGATVAYVRGDTETTLDASPARVVAATEQAFKDLDLHVITKESSGLDGKIVGRTARDVKMTVVVKGESENTSKISIRTGTFGDDAMQARVLEKIRENLGTTAAAAVATTQPADAAHRTASTTQPADSAMHGTARAAY